MTNTEALHEMERIHALAVVEQRDFNDGEAARFAELRLQLTAKEPTMESEIIDKPAGALRAFAGQQHQTLFDAVRDDGTVARMIANGKARVDLPVSLRALGSDQALNPAPGIAVAPDFKGLLSGYVPLYGRLLDAMASITTDSNAVVYTRLAYANAGNAAAKTQELALKPQSTLSSVQVTQTIDTWAHWIPASKQVLDDVSGLRALLDTTLAQGLKDKVDAGIFAEMTGTGRFTAYSATSGETIADALVRIATVMRIGGASNVHIGVNPATFLSVALAKDSTGRYIGLPANIPGNIVPAASVPAGNLLAWADDGAIWCEREGVSVVAGLNSDDFVRNQVSLLAETRGSVLTLNPAHVYYGPATA